MVRLNWITYLYNSVVGNEFPKFKSFFEKEFVPYLKIIVKNEYKFFDNNFFFDFFLILKNMKKDGIKLPVINNDSRTALIEKDEDYLKDEKLFSTNRRRELSLPTVVCFQRTQTW